MAVDAGEDIEKLRKLLRRRYDAGERSYVAISFRCGKFASAELDHDDLSCAWFHDADFRKASMRGANLAQSVLAGADLCGANLEGANLANANLDGARLAGARIVDVVGVPTRLPNEWTTVRTAHGWILLGPKANLAGVNLSGLDLNGLNLEGANFEAGGLAGTNLGLANLRRANLTAADLRGTNFAGAELQDACVRNTSWDTVIGKTAVTADRVNAGSEAEPKWLTWCEFLGRVAGLVFYFPAAATDCIGEFRKFVESCGLECTIVEGAFNSEQLWVRVHGADDASLFDLADAYLSASGFKLDSEPVVSFREHGPPPTIDLVPHVNRLRRSRLPYASLRLTMHCGRVVGLNVVEGLRLPGADETYSTVHAKEVVFGNKVDVRADGNGAVVVAGGNAAHGLGMGARDEGVVLGRLKDLMEPVLRDLLEHVTAGTEVSVHLSTRISALAEAVEKFQRAHEQGDTAVRRMIEDIWLPEAIESIKPGLQRLVDQHTPPALRAVLLRHLL